MEGNNALHSQGPAPDRTYSSVGHADVGDDSLVFAGRLRHGRADDSDPANERAIDFYDTVWNGHGAHLRKLNPLRIHLTTTRTWYIQLSMSAGPRAFK